jgi:hypothetical protein
MPSEFRQFEPVKICHDRSGFISSLGHRVHNNLGTGRTFHRHFVWRMDGRLECCGDSFCEVCYDYHVTYFCIRSLCRSGNRCPKPVEGTFSANGGIFRNRQLNHSERNAEPNAKAASVKA